MIRKAVSAILRHSEHHLPYSHTSALSTEFPDFPTHEHCEECDAGEDCVKTLPVVT